MVLGARFASCVAAVLGLGFAVFALGGCATSTSPSGGSEFSPDAGSHDAARGDEGFGDDSAPPISVGDDGGQGEQDGTVGPDACDPSACGDGSGGYCGDGVLQAGEQCDDGNSMPGDGCSGTCTIEPGWACPVPGKPCVQIWVCGNGHIDPGEQCDDGNTMSGDGCSSTCQVEPGYVCPNHNGVGGACVKLPAPVCGDGMLEGTEQCDDGNTTSGDGCSSTCQLEPGFTCPTPGAPCKRIEFCGDSILELDIGEQCDDGNMVSGDGCSATCQLEPGYVCPTPGQPCVSTVRCGDGRLGGSEQCDDGNNLSGDGCSATCQLEPGWICPTPGAKCTTVCGDGIVAGREQCDLGALNGAGSACSASCTINAGYACVTSTPPASGDAGADASAPLPTSTCHQTVCGDGIKEGSEQCDDGNRIPYDGCSPTCTIDPKCNGVGTCTSVCGDGLVEPPEQCDLGASNGPESGCSATCQLDPSSGWYCSNVTQPPASTLVIPILYRDMLYWNTTSLPNPPVPSPPGGGHPDFNCGPGLCQSNGNTVAAGIAAAMLGADGKPVFAGVGTPYAVISDPTGVSYCWWYHDSGCSAGGANPYAKLVYLDLAGNPTTLTLTQGASGTYTYANKQFFPIDGLGWNAGMNPQLDTDCEPGLPNAPRNFSFTSELHYVFTYQASVAASAAPAVFNFTGDDDVWGFINNHLVIDLGGVHNPLSASYTLNTANAATLGLTDGGWYSIDLFQAEAHVCRSTYALTLSNFAHLVTQCHDVCGDGIVEGNEQCDPGPAGDAGAADASAPDATTSDGGASGVYGGCNPDCTRGPYCGDGIVQNPPEQCDDGVNLVVYGGTSKQCGPGCRWAPYCGDGVVSNGEQCDNGANNVPASSNPYGSGLCTTACTLAPYCGDGVVEAANGEECDDGPNNGSSGSKCDAMCKLKCGDGIPEPGKACDLGAANNVGGYGGCNPDCTPGPYCGDGVLQNPPEQCDYGTANNTGGYGGCNADCTLGPYCGDGIVQNPPEQCDDGANNVVPAAAYGMGICTTTCMPAPYCGDGVVQPQFGEQCDGPPNCSPTCQKTKAM